MHRCARRLVFHVRVNARLSNTRLFTHPDKHHTSHRRTVRGFTQNTRVQSEKTETDNQDARTQWNPQETSRDSDSSASLAARDAEVLDDLQNLLREETQTGWTSNSSADELIQKFQAAMTVRKVASGRPSSSAEDPQSSIRRSRRPEGEPGTVIITGGSGAIGRAIGIEFAAHGYWVILCGRNTAALAQGLKDLKNASGIRPSVKLRNGPGFWHETVAGDVCSDDFHNKLYSTVKRRFDSAVESTISKGYDKHEDAADLTTYRRYMPSVLVNCAGISQSSLLISSRFKDETMQSILDTNLMSTIKCTRRFVLQHMAWKRRYQKFKSDVPLRSAVVINVSSLLATHGGAGASVYAASKAGMIGMYSNHPSVSCLHTRNALQSHS